MQPKQNLWAGSGETGLFSINNGTILLLIMGWLKAAEGGGAEGAKNNQCKLLGSTTGEMCEENTQEPKAPFLRVSDYGMSCDLTRYHPFIQWNVTMQHWSPGCYLEGEGKNHSKAVVSCAGVEAWAAAGHNRKIQHMSSPRRSVAKAKPLAMQISWHRSYISLETQEHSWEQQWHLGHTSVGQALLFLCIPHHASADTTISLPGRTYDYPLNNLKERDETSRPHCQIK